MQRFFVGSQRFVRLDQFGELGGDDADGSWMAEFVDRGERQAHEARGGLRCVERISPAPCWRRSRDQLGADVSRSDGRNMILQRGADDELSKGRRRMAGEAAVDVENQCRTDRAWPRRR